MKTAHAVIGIVCVLAIAGTTLFLASYHGSGKPTSAAAAPPPASSAASTAASTPAAKKFFTPPPESAMPTDEFGKMVSLGEQIFEHPAEHAPAYVGNRLRCSSCHLDAGRKAGSAPMWAAYVAYPAYRSKSKHVNTFEERLQGCFRFSMNGKAPPLGDKTLVALETYAYWLAKGAPTDTNMPGRGFPKLAKPSLPADYARGQKVYAENCALCHAADGGGQLAANGSMGFPALWGPHSFNWGAGMGSVRNAAAFIKANMPLSRGNTLSDQDAWDVATYMDSQERPQDPRFTGTVEATRAKFHDSPNSMYGKTVNGHVLGSTSVPAGGSLRGAIKP